VGERTGNVLHVLLILGGIALFFAICAGVVFGFVGIVNLMGRWFYAVSIGGGVLSLLIGYIAAVGSLLWIGGIALVVGIVVAIANE
jgi:hypothetical protein